MTTYALVILFFTTIGLALLCLGWQPQTLRWAWPAAACLTGALLGVSAPQVLLVTLVAAGLTWPVRRAWA